MAGSNQDWNESSAPVGGQNQQQQSGHKKEQLGQTPGPGEQPEQDGSARRQQEQGVIGGTPGGGDQDRPQGSSRGSMSGGTTPGRQQSLEGRTTDETA